MKYKNIQNLQKHTNPENRYISLHPYISFKRSLYVTVSDTVSKTVRPPPPAWCKNVVQTTDQQFGPTN